MYYNSLFSHINLSFLQQRHNVIQTHFASREYKVQISDVVPKVSIQQVTLIIFNTEEIHDF